MMATCKENKQWSGKKMEVGEGLKTLECLRGRLLAERQASRSAKEEEDLMGKKLIELEIKIRKETELRNKAEKRLKLLIKKLESLNIPSTSVTSENSTSSEISSKNSFATKEMIEQESRSEKNLVSSNSENQEEKVPEINTENKPNHNSPDRSNSSPNSKSPNKSYTDLHRSYQISQIKDQSFSAEVKENENENYMDNLAASITGASPAAKSEAGAMKMKGIHESATDVHDALKHIRGNVESSFERRNHMKAIMSM